MTEIIYILSSKPSRQHSRALLEGQEKRKDRKTQKSRNEEKVVGFSSSSLLPARKPEAVTQGGTRRIDNLTWRRTQGAGIVKGWEDMQDRGRIPDTRIT